MFVIKKRRDKPVMYYVGMIAGVMVHISEIKAKAKVFETEIDALAEIELYKVFLKDAFEVVHE